MRYGDRPKNRAELDEMVKMHVRLFVRLVQTCELGSEMVRFEAMLAEKGHVHDPDPPPGGPIDPYWHQIEPDPIDVAKLRRWGAGAERLAGRVFYWDSRRGTPLTVEQIRKGLADFVDRAWFTPEALSVYLLRWLQGLVAYADEEGLLAGKGGDPLAGLRAYFDVDAEGDLLAGLRRDRWMVDGLAPDASAKAKFRLPVFADLVRGPAVGNQRSGARGVMLIDSESPGSFWWATYDELRERMGSRPGWEELGRQLRERLEAYDLEFEAVVLERRPTGQWLYVLGPGDDQPE